MLLAACVAFSASFGHATHLLVRAPGLGARTSTGLGLFIARLLVQLHRGKLWVESQEGKGTCFWVVLF